MKRINTNFQNEKERFIKNKKFYPFDFSIISIHPITLHKKLVVDIFIHEDLDVFIVSYDIGEIVIYNCGSFIPIDTIN